MNGCQIIRPVKPPGRRTRAGHRPKTGIRKPGPIIDDRNSSGEEWHVDGSPIQNWQGVEKWFLRFKPEGANAFSTIAQSEFSEPVLRARGDFGCYYVVGGQDDGKWRTGRSNIVTISTGTVPATDRKQFPL